jgi:predicted small secreted protein
MQGLLPRTNRLRDGAVARISGHEKIFDDARNRWRTTSFWGSDSDLLPPRSRYPEHEPGCAYLPPPGSASGLNFFPALIIFHPLVQTLAGGGTIAIQRAFYPHPARPNVAGLPRRGVMVKKLLVIVAVSSGLLLSACNTVRGVGEDVESVANEVDEET